MFVNWKLIIFGGGSRTLKVPANGIPTQLFGSMFRIWVMLSWWIEATQGFCLLVPAQTFGRNVIEATRFGEPDLNHVNHMMDRFTGKSP